jgi:hypothetical protein
MLLLNLNRTEQEKGRKEGKIKTRAVIFYKLENISIFCDVNKG